MPLIRGSGRGGGGLSSVQVDHRTAAQDVMIFPYTVAMVLKNTTVKYIINFLVQLHEVQMCIGRNSSVFVTGRLLKEQGLG